MRLYSGQDTRVCASDFMLCGKCNIDGKVNLRTKTLLSVAGPCALVWPGLAFADGGISAGAQAMLLIIAVLLTVGVLLGAVAAWLVKKKWGIIGASVTLVTLTAMPLTLFFLYLWYIQRPLW